MRYIKVPVMFWDAAPLGKKPDMRAKLETEEVMARVGRGPTEDEALADLLQQYGYEEAKPE